MRIENMNGGPGIFSAQDADDSGTAARVSISGADRAKKGTDAVFMGNYLNGKFDPVEQKRAFARNKAYKIIHETFASERKTDGELQERAEHAKQLRREKAQAQRQIKAIDDQMEELRREYGVDKDSEEQKALERMTSLYGGAGDMLQAAGTQSGEPLTEYQKRALELDSYKQPYRRTIEICERGMYDQAGIAEEYAVIRGIEHERLKHSPMLKAAQEAEEILAAASEEVMGMLVDEAKDHIDEKQEEEQERAEERKEEKLEEQEKLEKAEERREELEALADPEHEEEEHDRPQTDVLYGDPLTENLLKMDAVHSEVKREIGDIVQKMGLVEEDLKGIRVDESL